MKAAIKQQDLSNEYYFQEGCFIIELSNSSDDPDISIAQARVKVGVTTRWHRLKDTIERYYIVSGCGRVEVGDLPTQDVTCGDIVLIPSMCRQRISNTGDEDLIFLAICSPPFSSNIYIED